jgi:hypothetical protein
MLQDFPPKHEQFHGFMKLFMLIGGNLLIFQAIA